MARVVIPGFRKIETTSSGGQGTTNYEELSNKPSINNVPLTGNTITEELHLDYDGIENTPTIPVIDAELDETSENGIQNKVVAVKVNELTQKNTSQDNSLDSLFESVTNLETATSELQTQKADKTETTVNLLNPTLETTTKNGVTCTNNGDGTYTLSGAPTKSTQFLFTTALKLKENEKYKFLFEYTGSDYTGINIELASADGEQFIHNGEIFTASSELYGAYVEGYTPATFNGTLRLMVTTNLNATTEDIVPYTGDTGQLNKDVAEIRKKTNNISNMQYGTMQCSYVDANTLAGSVALDNDIKSATVSLIVKSDSAYKNVNILALNVADKILTVQALGMNFTSDSKVTVSYIAVE